MFQFQFRFDAVFIDPEPFAMLLLASLTELETVVDDDAADDVVSMSHFGHRIILLSDEWHCSWSKIAACVAKRIPQSLTLHLVVMTLFRLLIPSETIEQYQKYVSTFFMRILYIQELINVTYKYDKINGKIKLRERSEKAMK